jgi:hypothetical protein
VFYCSYIYFINDANDHNAKCKIFAEFMPDNSLVEAYKLIWKPAIKAAISTANLCFTAVTFT